MDKVIEVLNQLDFDTQEAKIYVSLIDLGQTTVSEISKRSEIGRVNCYQIIEKLIQKGFISEVIKNNIKYFSAVNPNILKKQLEEKSDNLNTILPELETRFNKEYETSKVETYQGKKGINSILKLILEDNEVYHLLGGAEEACRYLELENKVFVSRAEKQNLHGKILARKSDVFFYGKNEEVKYLDDEMISTTTMAMWGNKTAIFVWTEPYYAILINNKDITSSNMSTFNYMWKIAKEKK